MPEACQQKQASIVGFPHKGNSKWVRTRDRIRTTPLPGSKLKSLEALFSALFLRPAAGRLPVIANGHCKLALKTNIENEVPTHLLWNRLRARPALTAVQRLIAGSGRQPIFFQAHFEPDT